MSAVDSIKLEIPRSVVADIIMERLNLDVLRPAARRSALPTIGEAYQGGIYAGPTLHDNVLHALVLLPGEKERIDWNDAAKWADEQGGVLPSRIDQLVLFKNVKSEFKEAYYWSGEQYAPYADYAWYQGFSGGYQGNVLKDNVSRARAVRRLVIE